MAPYVGAPDLPTQLIEELGRYRGRVLTDAEEHRPAEREGKLRDRVVELEQQIAALRFAADQGDLSIRDYAGAVQGNGGYYPSAQQIDQRLREVDAAPRPREPEARAFARHV